jgi:acetyltransferase-like isoleucine patch superfamily enzyme
MLKKISRAIIKVKWFLKNIRSINADSLLQPPIDPLTALRKGGNLQVGQDTDLRFLKIYHPLLLKEGFCNIKIGDNNLLDNISINLYQDSSKVKIGDRVYIGPNTNLNCYNEIEVGTDVMFSWGCTIMDTDAHSLKAEERKDDVINWKRGKAFKDWSKVISAKIKIGDKCWIGFNAIILKGVELGEGCIVAAGSVVTKNFEPYSVIGGNPAILIRKAT